MKNEDTMPNAIGVTVDVRRRRFSFNSPIYPQAIYFAYPKNGAHTHTQLRSQSRKSLQKKYYYLFFWWRKIRFENFLCDECAQAVWVSVCFVGHARDWGKGAASFWMCGGDATVRPVPVCRADVSNNAILWSIPRVRACLSSVAAHNHSD